MGRFYQCPSVVALWGAIVVVFGGLLLFAWNVDRKDKVTRAGLDELPRV